jgi:hypothetical protein
MEDLGAEALEVAAMFPPGSTARARLKRVVLLPRTSAADLEAVFEVIRTTCTRSQPAGMEAPR